MVEAFADAFRTPLGIGGLLEWWSIRTRPWICSTIIRPRHLFCSGWVADKFRNGEGNPRSAGTNLLATVIGIRAIYKLTPNEFRSDTRQAKNAIEQIAGCAVLGYRAPSWSITKQCLWAIDVLAEEGFVYDSSIFPIRHDLYGVPNAQRTPYVHQCKADKDCRSIRRPLFASGE